ncbi:MAG: AmmeMemoRadiSam system protein B [Planctomycetes bacterium]|nr:AmmeMemoRadiSam system protein B [Planctomycetota bacterium]
MLWNPTLKPRLRPVEPFRHSGDGSGTDGATIGLRDPSGISEVSLTLSPAALHVLSLMDGEHTCEEIRAKFHAASGRPLSIETLTSILHHLEQARFLEGAAFEDHYRSLLAEYRRRGVRDMPHAEALGIVAGDGRLFDEMLEQVPEPFAGGRVCGLVAPHLDYPRGRPCYARAYAALRHRPAPRRVVILGTNHFGRSTSAVATANDFATPLGRTQTDVPFLERLEGACGDLRAFEFDHVREHSVELQLAWLQHLYGADAFHVVAVLCPDPCGPTGTAPADARGTDLAEFALALGRAIHEDPTDTLLVAGADLSHVGANFGDERLLDAAFLQEVRGRDQQALRRLLDAGPEAFRAAVAEQNNPTRVCSAGCMFTLATALQGSKPTLLGYHQAVDRPTQTCVTCAAVVYT